MAKLVTMFFVLIVIQACLLLYGAPTPANTNLWDYVINIDNWNSLTFIVTLVSIAAGIGLVGVAAGSIFGFKTDFLMLAPAIGGLISMGVVFVNLGNVIRAELIGRVFTDCTGILTNCTPVNFILAITIAPMALFYVWTIISWWRNTDY